MPAGLALPGTPLRPLRPAPRGSDSAPPRAARPGRFKATAAPAPPPSVKALISGQPAVARDDLVARETPGLQSFTEIVEPLWASVFHLETGDDFTPCWLGLQLNLIALGRLCLCRLSTNFPPTLPGGIRVCHPLGPGSSFCPDVGPGDASTSLCDQAEAGEALCPTLGLTEASPHPQPRPCTWGHQGSQP